MQPDVHVVLGDVEVEVAALLGVGVEQLLGVRLRGRENGFEYVTLSIRKLSVYTFVPSRVKYRKNVFSEPLDNFTLLYSSLI